MGKLSVPEILEMKTQGKKIAMITAFDYPSALMVETAGFDIILMGDSMSMAILGYDTNLPVTLEEMIHHTQAVSRGAQNTFIISDMPFGSYGITIEQGVANASRLIKEGRADAVKLEGGVEVADSIKAIVRSGIPAMGHIGLTQQRMTQLGGYIVRGNTDSAAKQLIEDAKALEMSGAFGIVLESIPLGLAKEITDSVTVPTIGIGAGPHCDGQVLIFNDVLGLYNKFTPAYVKQYANLGEIIHQALTQFKNEIQQGLYPQEEHSFK